MGIHPSPLGCLSPAIYLDAGVGPGWASYLMIIEMA